MRTFLVLLAVCALPAWSFAQQPVFTLTAGFAHTYNDEGNGRSSLNGWYLDPSYSVTKMLAIAADFAGSYGSYRGARENSHVYAAGPQFSFSNHTRVTPLVYAEAGDSRSSRAGSVSNAFFFEVGGGANIKLANRISLQIIPAEYDFSHPGAARNSYTARAGLVFALTQK